MAADTIPITAYAFIGITTLVLSYVTFMDNEPEAKPAESATTLLPNVNPFAATSAPAPAQPSPVLAQAMAIPTSIPAFLTPKPEQPVAKTVGGKKSKKTKRVRHKQKKTKRKRT
jgi:hypothetical protein